MKIRAKRGFLEQLSPLPSARPNTGSTGDPAADLFNLAEFFEVYDQGFRAARAYVNYTESTVPIGTIIRRNPATGKLEAVHTWPAPARGLAEEATGGGVGMSDLKAARALAVTVVMGKFVSTATLRAGLASGDFEFQKHADDYGTVFFVKAGCDIGSTFVIVPDAPLHEVRDGL